MNTQIAFSDGGYWMYAVLVLASVAYAALAVQLKRPGAKAMPIAVGGVGAVVMTGLLGTALGVISGMAAVSGAPAGEQAVMAARVLAIAPLPLALATALGTPAAILGGVLAARR